MGAALVGDGVGVRVGESVVGETVEGESVGPPVGLLEGLPVVGEPVVGVDRQL